MVVEILGVDPRCLSTEKLIAPDPLPYISRRSLRRVKDRISVQSICNCCGGTARLVSNDEIYGREYGDWPYAYLCSDCGAYVGLHPNTDLPLGTLADRPTREARKASKALFFDVLMKRYGKDRNRAYAHLAAEMGIDQRRCHFGLFGVAECQAAATALAAIAKTKHAPAMG